MISWTADPVVDAETHATRRENKPHIICCECGQALYDADIYYDIDGDIYCNECGEEMAEIWLKNHEKRVDL